MTFDPYPPTCLQFFTTIRRQIWQIFDPSPLNTADVLNGWSLIYIFIVLGDYRDPPQPWTL